jgi:hypothetical protein
MIVVSGALANRCYNGGGAWVRLNWLLGLRRLGHAVHFVEVIGRQTCVNASGAVTAFSDSTNRAYFRQVMRCFGLSDVATLVFEGEEQTDGLSFRELLDLAASADLLVNLSGHLASAPLLNRFRRKAYIDLDPGYTQLWEAAGNPGACLAGYDDYFSVGANVGWPDCPIPTCGITCWHVADPAVVAADPETFRRYVRASGAEFSAAQGVYVETVSGWFSDRTAGYLASGKPVLVQDTGFGRHYPVGDGLLTFRTPDEASTGAKAIVQDYVKHSRAARAIAEDYFDSDKVLGRFLDEVGVGS